MEELKTQTGQERKKPLLFSHNESKMKKVVMSTKHKQQEFISAARNGRIDDVRKYLKDDTIDVNGKWRGKTALYLACKYGHRDIAELLLDHRDGTYINAVPYSGLTPLMWACNNDYASVAKLLLDRGCNINDIDNLGNTALHYACYTGSMDCVKELLAHGADTYIKDKYGKTPLDDAREYKQYAVIILLLEEKKRTEQAKMNHDQDVEAISKLSAFDAKLTECIASTSEEQLSSTMVETIIDRRCKKINRDLIDRQDKAITKMTSDLDSKVEAINSRSTAILENKIGQSLRHLQNRSRVQNTKSDINHRREKLMNYRITLLEEKMSRSLEILKNQLNIQDIEVAKREMISGNDEEKMKTLASDHEAHQVQNLRSDINHRCDTKLMNDRIRTLEDKMNRSFEKMTNQVTISIAKVDKMDEAFENITNQLTIIIAKVDKCTTNLSTIMGHLVSKEAANEEKGSQLCKKRKRSSEEHEKEAVSDGTRTAVVDAVDDESNHQNGGGSLEKESSSALNAFKTFCRRS